MIRHPARAGKSAALRTGALAARGRWIVMMDGDYTYRGQDAKRLVDDIVSNGHDIAAGSRLHGQREPGSLRWINVVGNRFLTRLAGELIGGEVKDLCTGLFPMVFRQKRLNRQSAGDGRPAEPDSRNRHGGHLRASAGGYIADKWR